MCEAVRMAVTPLWHQWRLPYIRIASSFITSPRFSPYFLAPCCRALLPKHLTARNYVARLANPRRSLCNGHHRDGKVGNLVNCRASRISTFTTEDSPSSSTSPAASRTLLVSGHKRDVSILAIIPLCMILRAWFFLG